MIRIIFQPVFDAEIVNAEAEFGWALEMTPESDCYGYCLASVWFKEVFKRRHANVAACLRPRMPFWTLMQTQLSGAFICSRLYVL